ncbi:hypothetical protein [Streptomyces murinus]|uniref:hypothetical protein n=1 Tax=Streptomyces murinus TaxID=33900 RepID=UPI002113B08D|nr:hypothetical protein [Streptomyces murinus]
MITPALIATEAGGRACQLKGKPLDLSASTEHAKGERVPAIFGTPGAVKEMVVAMRDSGTL